MGRIRRTLARWFGWRLGGQPPSTTYQLKSSEFSLSAADVHRLIAAAKSPRDVAIMRLFAETGMRRHEVLSLCAEDVDLARGLVTVRRGKGSKMRVIPITNDMHAVFARLGSVSSRGPVFTSRTGKVLSLRQVNRIVAGIGRRAGVAHPNPRHRQITCHLLRHTFARHWKAQRGSIESLSKILGHASVKTTWNEYGTEGLADIQRNYRRTTKRMYRTEY